jgi:UDP-2-acetamido-2,6-beta-L-arabino-hexul-4-ose reductase
MNVLITGSHGFIGKNLIVFLKNEENANIIELNKDDNDSIIKNKIEKADFVFHLAGVNRSTDNKDFYKGNSDLTKKIVDLIKINNKDIPFVMTSSIQAKLNNDYGKSKKLAEDYVRKNLNNFYIFRLHNVFGKWCKPNYNSVIATFCYNISHNLSITINDKNTELELVYIDDVCKSLVSILTKENIAIKKNYYYFIPTRYKKTLGEISDMLYQFKNDTNSIYVPSTGDDFTKKLFATYISYVPLNNLSIPVIKNIDERGSFSELVRTFDCGQFSVSFSKPGIIRGNHFHNTKMERFIVVKGIAKITFESIIDNSKYEFVVNGDEIKVITIPVGYSHKIENIGNDEMILFIWCNELFDKNNPDTYFKEISEE